MEDVNIDIIFNPTRAGSLRGSITVRHGEQILLVDTMNLASEKARDEFLKKLLTENPGFDKDGFKDKLKNKLMQTVAQELEKTEKQNTTPPNFEENQPIHRSSLFLEKTDEKLVNCAQEFLERPDLVKQAVKHVQKLGVAGEDELILMIYLIGTSRLLPRPLAGVVMGASSAGKSYVINQTARLFPDEATLHAHRLTPHALQHMPAGSLIHRFVVAGERSRQQDEGAADATRGLREMIGDGKLTLAIAVKGASSKWETVHIEQQGPIAYVESTTLGIREIFDEDRTRFVLMSSDERQVQTDAIINQLAEVAAKPGDPDTEDSILALHHTIQRLLQPCRVVVPFAQRLTASLPHERLEVRRTFGHLLSFIQAVTLLYQYQRKRDDHNQIIATLDDYEVVRLHLSGPLARSLGYELTSGAADLIEYIKEYGKFTIPEITGKLHLSPNTIRGRVKELEQAGQVTKLESGSGQKAAVYSAVADPPSLHKLTLPLSSELEDKKALSTITEKTADKT